MILIHLNVVLKLNFSVDWKRVWSSMYMSFCFLLLGVAAEGMAGEKNLHDADFTISLFRFCQLLCEGHNLEFQNYLRLQAGNSTNVNIIICTVDYLLSLQVMNKFYWIEKAFSFNFIVFYFLDDTTTEIKKVIMLLQPSNLEACIRNTKCRL